MAAEREMQCDFFCARFEKMAILESGTRRFGLSGGFVGLVWGWQVPLARLKREVSLQKIVQ